MPQFSLTQAETELLKVCLSIAQREFIAKTTQNWTPMWREVVRKDAKAVADLVRKIG